MGLLGVRGYVPSPWGCSGFFVGMCLAHGVAHPVMRTIRL